MRRFALSLRVMGVNESPGEKLMSDLNEAPLNPLPAIVWILALPMIAMELVVNAGSAGIVGGPTAIGWRSQAIQEFGFSPAYLRQMFTLQQYPLDGLYRPFTYPFVHVDLTQALFVVVFLLALGKFVGEVFRWWAVLVVFLTASLAAALAYTAIPYTQAGLIGGYPPVYGLIGAFTYIKWLQAPLLGTSRISAFRLIGFLMGMRILFGVIGLASAGVNADISWNWVAELAGFIAGFAMSFAVSPGGWNKLLSRVRAR